MQISQRISLKGNSMQKQQEELDRKHTTSWNSFFLWGDSYFLRMHNSHLPLNLVEIPANPAFLETDHEYGINSAGFTANATALLLGESCWDNKKKRAKIRLRHVISCIRLNIHLANATGRCHSLADQQTVPAASAMDRPGCPAHHYNCQTDSVQLRHG